MVDDLLSQDEINALLSGPPAPASSGSDGLSPADTDVLNEVASIFSSSATNVIGMLAGRGVTADVRSADIIPQGDFSSQAGDGRAFLFSIVCDGFDNAPAALVVSERGALAMADLMMGGDGKELPAEANDLYLSASQEGLSQIAGSAFTSVSGLLKGQRLVPSGTGGALKSGSWIPFESLGEDVPLWSVHIGVDVSDVGAFDMWFQMPLEKARDLAGKIQATLAPPAPQPAPAAAPASAAAPRPQAAQPSAATAPMAASSVPAPRPMPQVDVRPAEFVPLQSEAGMALPANLDLILDIPVRITVELGRTRKTIGEVLNMAPGSVVELEKMAGEPVDVLVNGKLVARGEVVVIDESFGVRITEIVSKAERIRSVGV